MTDAPLILRHAITRTAAELNFPPNAHWQQQLAAIEHRRRTETLYLFQIAVRKLSPYDDPHADEHRERTTRFLDHLRRIADGREQPPRREC